MLSNKFQLPKDCSPMICELFDYWLSIHPNEGLPGRQHFDPLEIFGLSRNIWLLDVDKAPLRFRVRRIGAELIECTNRDITGRFLDEFYENLEATEAGNHLVYSTEKGVPTYRRGMLISKSTKYYDMLERIILPLATDGENVDMLLNFTRYLDHKEQDRLRPVRVVPSAEDA